jgi:hypothetical protein
MLEQSSGSFTHEPQVVLSGTIIIPLGQTSHLTTIFSQAPQHSSLAI